MKQYSFLEEAGLIAGARNLAASGMKKAVASPKTAGAIAGGVAGAATGLKKDADGQRHVLRNAALGAGVGVAAGAGAKKFLGGKGYASRAIKAVQGQ